MFTSYQLQNGIAWRRLETHGEFDSKRLRVHYRAGYIFWEDSWVISGKVPTGARNNMALDLKCAGHQLIEDIRSGYMYATPNVSEQIRNQEADLGGRPAWISTFHLKFPGAITSRYMVAVVLIDLGKPYAAVLWISFRDDLPQYFPKIDRIVDRIVGSVVPA